MYSTQSFSILIILIAAGRAWADFDPTKISTWLFIGGLTGMLIMIVWLYLRMEKFTKSSSPHSM